MYHKPVLLHQSIEGLKIIPNGTYIDATFGGGGHSRGILEKLGNGGLLGFDQDTDAQQNNIEDERFVFIKSNFKYVKNFMRYYGIQQVDGVLADLGVSSHQFDSEKRGFSFRFEQAVLDMRMNKDTKISAKQILNSYSKEELQKIFKEYGELKNSNKLANNIITARKNKEIYKVKDLLDAVSNCFSSKNKNKALAKLFQALRIEVNNELELLKQFLLVSKEILKTGGRLVVITYHSLEDRLVKNWMKAGNFSGEIEKDIYGNPEAPFQPVNRRVITPNEEEIQNNNRARSAKLRIAERLSDK